MVLDTSALYEILAKQEGHEKYFEAVQQGEELFVSAATVFGTAVVLFGRSRGNRSLIDDLEAMLTVMQVHIVAFDAASAWAAFDAYARFGKGIRPAASI